jgi:hypothetical protein
MSNNTFNGKRFLLLFRQYFLHNTNFLLLASGAYVGVAFILLSLVQMGNDIRPHDIESFVGFSLGFVIVFGILYSGHSFPAFRSKESTINYLLVPASLFEKFMFELLSRIGLIFLLLPILFWVTFHLQGYFFTMFTDAVFEPIGLHYLSKLEFPEIDSKYWFATLITSAVLLGFILPFTGSAMFSKQPLVKTLFSVAIIIMFYSGVIYLVLEQFGIGKYNPTDSMWLIPRNENSALRFFSIVIIITNAVMLFVGYRKLKEREV